MVDRAVLTTKFGELEKRIANVRGYNPPAAGDFTANQERLDLVAFNLMLAVQACLDIATHIIADEEWTVAVTLAESFERLAEHGVISQATAATLHGAVGLRNIVAHGYSSAAPERIHAAASTGLADLERFAQEVSTWLRTRS
jgi:uncharacterized protein YutE (UPF0331/DUF86 family)